MTFSRSSPVGCTGRRMPGMCASRKGHLTVLAGVGRLAGMSSPSPSGPLDMVTVMLDGLIADVHLDELHRRVGESVGFGSNRDARGLLDLAALAFLACGATSANPLEFDELEHRYLPESPVRGNVAHQKRRYALTAAILIASGVEPEEISWWKADDLWTYAFDAVVVFVRAASEHRQLPIATICTALRDQT